MRRGSGLERAPTLLRVLLLASGGICTGAGVVLGEILSHSLTREGLNAEETSLVQYVDGIVRPTLVQGDRVKVPWSKDVQLAKSVNRQKDIVVVKVWSVQGTHGVLAWTNRRSPTSSGGTRRNQDRGKIGRRFALDDELGEAIHENKPIAALVGTGSDGEDAF